MCFYDARSRLSPRLQIPFRTAAFEILANDKNSWTYRYGYDFAENDLIKIVHLGNMVFVFIYRSSKFG
jgi:hypothetical protein